MGLLIKGGEIITADTRYKADIFCDNGVITQIANDISPPAGAEVIDASGKYVFPGFIDPHTHIYLPFMGTFAKDDYDSATVAALCGGTTTVMDFAICPRDSGPLSAFETWLEKAQGIASCDFAFHMALTKFDDQVASELLEVIKKGVTSFKIFLAYKGALELEDEALVEALLFAKKHGVMVSAHCENAALIAVFQEKLVAEGKIEPKWQEASRPAIVEAEGTRHFCTMVELTGAHGYVVHLSNEMALRHAIEAKLRGANIWVETLISYLLLDKTFTELPDFEGAKYVMSPPLRDKREQPTLWNGIRSGLISTLGTDHAPFDMAQKEMGKDNFCVIPNGIPAIEDRVRLFYTHGVASGRLDLHQFVATVSTNAAKLFGLFPRKGTIQLGGDADLVVYNPDIEETLSVKTQHSKVDYNAFEGRTVRGRCDAVTVRGNVQVRDGQFVGEKGIGQFLEREPNH